LPQHIVLCLNCGSSSLKFALYQLGVTEELRLANGAVEGIGLTAGRLWIRGFNGDALVEIRREFATHAAAAAAVAESAGGLGLPIPEAAGHRIVHGGPQYTAPTRIDGAVLENLRRLVTFAPLHMPSAIEGIEAVALRFPGLPQVACFDTAFHRRMPQVAQRLPLSRDVWDQGIRRYGFHGLSYEYIVASLGVAAKGRLLIAHLGNGASLAAILDGRPVDTTMGFTPSGGLMMGTRSGDLDPGVMIHFAREQRYEAGRLETLVSERAGLLGVSDISSDMKTLLDKRKTDGRADEAVELFCYQLCKHIGAMAAVLGGLDTLVFTGGIGEHAAPVRSEVCRKLTHLGIKLDDDKNVVDASIISVPGSACTVRVVPTNEDLMIARHTRTVILETVIKMQEK